MPTWNWSRSLIPVRPPVKPRDFSIIQYTSLDPLPLECTQFYNQIEAYRILTYKELREHINDRFVVTSAEKRFHDSERLGRLLLKLPLLAELDKRVIEEIFFVGLIGRSIDCFLLQWFQRLFLRLGSVQIDKIIPCILKMSAASSTSPSPALQIKGETSEQSQQPQRQSLDSLPSSWKEPIQHPPVFILFFRH